MVSAGSACKRSGIALVTVGLPADYYSRTFHWAACCCTEFTDKRVIFIEQWGLVTTDGLDICGHFGSDRGLQFLLGNVCNPCLELE